MPPYTSISSVFHIASQEVIFFSFINQWIIHTKGTTSNIYDIVCVILVDTDTDAVKRD